MHGAREIRKKTRIFLKEPFNLQLRSETSFGGCPPEDSEEVEEAVSSLQRGRAGSEQRRSNAFRVS